MEQKQISCGRTSPVCDRLPPLSAKYPWLVAQNLEAEDDTGDQIFYTIHDPLSHYHCRIPELLERRIRACFHGWVILSKHPHRVEWSLWNPVTSKFIRLPPLILKDGDSDDINDCCLSSPPDDPSSILLLTRTEKPTIVFCRLHRKRKRLRWTEMSYAKQLRSITGDDGFLHSPTCCNGKVYALTTGYRCVILVDIVVNDKEVVISLLPFVERPLSSPHHYQCWGSFLNGSCIELFTILVGYDELTRKTLHAVSLFKLDMTSMMWEEMEDLKDSIFFVDLARGYSVFYSPAIASELGGYIHILGEMGKVIYSYHVKDKTISLSSMPCLDLPPRSEAYVSLWAMPECRLEGDQGEVKCKADSKKEEDKEDEIVVRSATNDEVEFNSMTNEPHEEKIEAHLLNIPFHVLDMIMELCVGVEYLNFRATCKCCHLAAPLIRWSNGTALRRLQTYSFVSPWLMMLDKDRGIITFTDPMFGDKYFIKSLPESIVDGRICCSRYGWLLIFSHFRRFVFFNPFTSDIRELPQGPYLESFCFSAPPTSPDCMVVGFTTLGERHAYIHFVAREPFWYRLHLNFGGADPFSYRFPTFYGRDLYALCNGGGLDVFREMGEVDYSWELVVAEEDPRSCCKSLEQYFLVKRDQHLLLVIMGEFGESVEVFKLNDSTEEWEKIDGLGRHMIYICGTTCLCIEAKTPEMENKIYFPRFHSGNGKIVFYSLETCRYHTFNGKNVQENFGDFCWKKCVFCRLWTRLSIDIFSLCV